MIEDHMQMSLTFCVSLLNLPVIYNLKVCLLSVELPETYFFYATAGG